MKACRKKNVFFLYMMGGDGDVPILNYMKHYRLDCPVIPDNNDTLRHVFRVQGIACVAIFDGDGTCIYNESMARNEDEYRKVIVRALRKVGKTNLKESAFVECGTVYPPAVREQKRIVHERMPSLAAGPDGRLHLAYVTDEAGSNDVLLRSADVRGRWGEPVTLAATDADEYAPSVAVTKDGGVVVAYAANPKGGRYDIYTVTASGGKVGKPKRVTRSPDDAMAPCLAADADRLWLSWYEWRKMGKLSRDREVFASRSSGRGWSKPLQVSPREVDGYEDHADPVIRPDGNGGAWVAWAWDYHETLPSRPPVKENSIFVRHIDSRMKMGPVLAAGFRGEGTARDYSPAIEVAKDGSPWVIWDNLHKASAGWSAKGVFVNRLAGEDFGEMRAGRGTRTGSRWPARSRAIPAPPSTEKAGCGSPTQTHRDLTGRCRWSA
ncbi:MAG: hypothetical protein ACYTDY_09760 [Planctomycetota bacterium]|jgi:hypothetical protein